jgi:hypothetical protein
VHFILNILDTQFIVTERKQDDGEEKYEQTEEFSSEDSIGHKLHDHCLGLH